MLRRESEEALVRRMLPGDNPDCTDRRLAWNKWYICYGEIAVRKFIRIKNNSLETDEDIFQNAMLVAYQEMERGRYVPQPGIPFTAYVKGIAHNKIREARRRNRPSIPLEAVEFALVDPAKRQPETVLENWEKRICLQQGMSFLGQGRQQVLERYIRGEETSEIADALAMTEATVRQHKCRGLKHLRQMAIAKGF